jgi:hypothetical protein
MTPTMYLFMMKNGSDMPDGPEPEGGDEGGG